MEERRYQPGESIIVEGGPGDFFYVTGSGELEVRHETLYLKGGVVAYHFYGGNHSIFWLELDLKKVQPHCSKCAHLAHLAANHVALWVTVLRLPGTSSHTFKTCGAFWNSFSPTAPWVNMKLEL